MEDVAAWQLLAGGGHLLPTDNADVVGGCQVLGSCIRVSVGEVVNDWTGVFCMGTSKNHITTSQYRVQKVNGQLTRILSNPIHEVISQLVTDSQRTGKQI